LAEGDGARCTAPAVVGDVAVLDAGGAGDGEAAVGVDEEAGGGAVPEAGVGARGTYAAVGDRDG
jgi:hypothetical protein